MERMKELQLEREAFQSLLESYGAFRKATPTPGIFPTEKRKAQPKPTPTPHKSFIDEL